MTENVISTEGFGLDTVIIRVEDGNYDELENAMDCIGATKQLFDGCQRVGRYGRLKNLKVKLNRGNLLIEGSWCKFYHGNNLECLTWEQSVEVFQALQNALQISLESAVIIRVDYGVNLITKLKPAQYFQHLAEHQKLHRENHFDSLYWKSADKTEVLAAYDKMNQSHKVGKRNIPPRFINKNVLRIEERFRRPLLKRRYNQSPTVKLLLTQEFQQDLAKRLIQHYQRIAKVGTINLSKVNGLTPATFEQLIALLHVSTVGQAWVMGLFHQLVEQEAFKVPEYVSRTRKRLLKLFSQPDLTDTPEPIKELDRKFEALKMLASVNGSGKGFLRSERKRELVSTE